MSLGIALTLLLGTAEVWAKGMQPVPAAAAPVAPAEPAADPTLAALAELTQMSDLFAAAGMPVDASYASREQAAQGLETFQGGDTVVIAGSSLAIIVLVVLLIVLL